MKVYAGTRIPTTTMRRHHYTNILQFPILFTLWCINFLNSSIAFSGGSTGFEGSQFQIPSKQKRKEEKILMTTVPTRPLMPPFPDGLCGGRLVTIPPSEHYLLDTNLSGNTLLLPPRDIQVWLPPDYDKYPDMRFPVLYTHDGQNAMYVHL